MTDGGASVVGAVEAGGTKFRMGRFTTDGALLHEERLPTDDPDTTLARVRNFFETGPRISALGIGCFGPIDLVAGSPTFGSILSTPKPDWSGVDVFGELGRRLGVPTAIESDVGAAALAEADSGAGVGKQTVCYVTVGTGIGGAIVRDGSVMRGHGHTEFGHIPTDRVRDDEFEGSCVYHRSCLEGMASGSAIAARAETGSDEPMKFVSEYLGQLVQTLTYVVAPDVISFGGGVFNNPGLIDEVRHDSGARMSRYSTNPLAVGEIDSYVVASPLGQDAGLIGAALMATKLARQHR